MPAAGRLGEGAARVNLTRAARPEITPSASATSPLEIARNSATISRTMRTLPAPLLAAQKSASSLPYLKALVSDRIGGIRRLAWSRLYTGSEPDAYHAAAMPGDGCLVRARVSGGRLYYQRVTSPGSGSNFASWTDLEAAAAAGVALCSSGSRLLLFFVDPNGTALRVRESTDNGATLGAAVTAATAAGAAVWLAAAIKSNGDTLLLYSVEAAVYAVRRTGGTWGTPSAWTNSAASITGLAVYHQGDWNTAVCGTDAPGNAFAWTAVYGDGFSQAANTWSPLQEVTRSSAGSGVGFGAPFLSQPDTYRLTFVETYSGSAGYSRPQHSFTPATADFASNLWREPVPFDLASQFGQALAFGAGAAWLSTPAGVWTASLNVPSLDLSADIVEAVTDDRPFDGRARITLRNDDGRYSTLPAAIKTGGELRLSPGYRTAAGALVSDGPAYWIDRIERRSGAGEATLVLEARDAWALLESWRARRQYTWAAGEKNVFGILQYVFARAGLEFSTTAASTASANLYPAFTVHPGDNGRSAVLRLLAMVPDVIFVRGEFAFLTEPLASEAADYAYGTDHRIYSGRYADGLPETDRVQVFGDSVFGERFDWPSVSSDYDRLRQVDDRNVATLALAEARADYVLRAAAMAASEAEITVPLNCGQELYDVLEVTDAAVGLSAARRRVTGISLRYSTGPRPAYEQRLRLSGV
jgi:hypothetical protein